MILASRQESSRIGWTSGTAFHTPTSFAYQPQMLTDRRSRYAFKTDSLPLGPVPQTLPRRTRSPLRASCRDASYNHSYSYRYHSSPSYASSRHSSPSKHLPLTIPVSLT